eukprot:10790295-Alexandrium_andersonii.AAC.1
MSASLVGSEMCIRDRAWLPFAMRANAAMAADASVGTTPRHADTLRSVRAGEASGGASRPPPNAHNRFELLQGAIRRFRTLVGGFLRPRA